MIMDKNEIVIVGAAIVDVLVSPANESVFKTGSCPADTIHMSIGGDALNEATVLAKLGNSGCPRVYLETVIGDDLAGKIVLRHCEKMGIQMDKRHIHSDLDTGINIVLVRKDGERFFLTNANGSLRRLTLEDITDPLPENAKILCFASIFVYPEMKDYEMSVLFKRAKKQGMTVCADMTKCKNGETVHDISNALSYVDYLLPNKEEAFLVTGGRTVEEAADSFLAAGVQNVVIKCGPDGCFVKNKETEMWISAEPEVNCVDTTGAGDSFVAGFVYGLSRGCSLEECAAYANRCGGMAVRTIGAVEWIMNRKQGDIL